MKRAPAILAGLAAILFFIVAPIVPALLHPANAQGAIEGEWATIANGDDIRGLAMTGNVVWAGTHHAGVVRWDPFDQSYKQFLAQEVPLASNEIRAVASDGQYTVWFATRNGVTEYEPGEDRWRTYTTADGLPSNNATAVARTPDGRIWIGTSQVWDGSGWSGGGLSICEPNGSCPTYTTENSDLPSNNVTDIAFAGSDAWIGTRRYKVFVPETSTTPATWADEGGGVARISDQTWTIFTREESDIDDNRINAVAVGSDGHIWFATPSGLERYNPAEDNWRRYRTDDGLEANSIRDVTVDGDNRVWALTYKNESTPVGVLNMLEGETWTQHGPDDGLSSQILWAVLADDQDRVWVGTGPWCRDSSGCDGGGLTEYRRLDNAWQVYRMSDDYLSSNQITDVAVTNDGTLWIATFGNGVSTRNANGQWQNFNMDNSDLSSNLVQTLAVHSDGSVWIGTQRYVEDGAWTGGGLNVYSGGSWTLYTDDNSGLPADEIMDIEIDADGAVWIATGDLRDGSGAGVVAYDTGAKTWLPTYTTDDGLPSNVVTDIALDDAGEQIWVATAPAGGFAGGGLAVFDGSEWTGYTSPDVPTWSSDDITGDFRAIAVDGDGNPWAGTYDSQGPLTDQWPFVEALVVHRPNGDWSKTTFSGQGFVSALNVASNGNVWAGISHGNALVSLSPEDIHVQPTRGGVRARIDGTWFAATAETSGLASSNVTALAFGPNGDVWIGTADAGLSVLTGAQPGPTPTNTPTTTPTVTDTPEVPDTPPPPPTITITPIPVTATPGDVSPPTEVPEAATLILVGTGLAGLGGYAAYRWRSRK